MAQEVFGMVPLNNGWVDIMATYPTAANLDLLIENKGNSNVELFPSSSASPPAASATGKTLAAGGSGYANQAHVYARAWMASSILIMSL